MMKHWIYALLAGFTLAATSSAENVTGADSLLCAPTTIRLCVETGDCYPVLPRELGIPEFFVIDTQKRSIHTTSASGVERRSEFASYSRENGVLMLQGVEAQRAFSMLIHEQTGLLSGSIAQDGFTVASFGHCTVN